MAQPFLLQLTSSKLLLTSIALVLYSSSALSHPLLHRRELAAPNATQEFLSTHNKARADVGVPALIWSSYLAGAASRLARFQRNEKNCKFTSTRPGNYGFNQQWDGWPASPRLVIGNWVSEKQFYNYTDNSCAPSHKCGMYTQVVWNTSAELGCGQASCKSSATLTLCFYKPAGNVVGDKPY